VAGFAGSHARAVLPPVIAGGPRHARHAAVEANAALVLGVSHQEPIHGIQPGG
jgi:hypothetical protein